MDSELDLLTDNNFTFHPKFTHQVFHRDETIKGMKDLNVTIYLTPTTLRPYVYWSCSDYGQQYDDVTNILRLSFGQENLITNREEFVKVLREEDVENFKLLGTKIGSIASKVP